jgi:hypothetical protein
MSNDKENALTIINSAARNGSLICFDRKNGFPQVDLYRTEITEISIDKKEQCFTINKKYMPKREMVDRIGEAAGVIFTKGETKSNVFEDFACGKHTVFTGIAQGKVRMPDGTWRHSSICEYEFNPTLRAMLDYEVTELTPQTKTYYKKVWSDAEQKKVRGTSGNTLATAILEYQKTGRQRANTGARLRVIRELVGLPIALTEEQIKKPIVFGRIVQNTSYLLQTPEGRLLASAMAVGADIPSLFGRPALTDNTEAETKSANETPPVQTPTGGESGASGETTPSDPSNSEKENDTAEFDHLTQILNEFLEEFEPKLNGKSQDGKNPYQLAKAELENPNATIQSREEMIIRIRNYLKKVGIDA